MTAVELTKTADGYRVVRYFRTLSAASAAVTLLSEVNEAAFQPIPQEVRLSDALEATEADDPPPHDGRPLFDNTQDAE